MAHRAAPEGTPHPTRSTPALLGTRPLVAGTLALGGVVDTVTYRPSDMTDPQTDTDALLIELGSVGSACGSTTCAGCDLDDE